MDNNNYTLSKSQIEILRLEQLIGGSVNTLCFSMMLEKSCTHSRLKNAIDQTVSAYCLHNYRLQLHKLEIEHIHSSRMEPQIVSFNDESSFTAWAETKAQEEIAIDGVLCEIIGIDICKKKSGFLIKIHHLIADGTSAFIIMDTLKSFCSNHAYNVNDYPYKNYINTEISYLSSKARQRDISFWQDAFFENGNSTAYVSDKKTVFAESNRLTEKICGELYRRIKQYCSEHGLSPAAFFLTIYSIYIKRLTGIDNFYVGTLFMNRTNKEEQLAVGNYFNTLPLPVSLQNSMTVSDLFQSTFEKFLCVMRRQRMSFSDVNELYRDMFHSSAPLFDSIINYQVVSSEYLSTWYSPGRQAESLITNIIDLESQGTFLIYYDYHMDKFKDREIRAIHNQLIGLSENALNDDTVTVERIERTPLSHKQRIAEFNDTGFPYPKGMTLIRYFSEQVDAHPNIPAVYFGSDYLTYQDFDRKSSVLASFLLKAGTKQGDIIALAAERSFEMLISIYAILKAGAAYMPIMPDYPSDRIGFMLEDSEANIILTLSKHNIYTPANIVRIDVDKFDFEYNGLGRVDMSNPEGVAYVIYTSGSTGKPKGAMISHSSAVTRIQWMNRIFGMSSHDIILQKTPFTFDVSVWELFWWAMFGGKVALLKQGDEKDPEQILLGVKKYGITKMHFVPSMLTAFLSYLEVYNSCEDLLSLKQVFASGEALMPSMVDKFYALIENCELINLYGPTECTVDVSCYRCKKVHEESIPIGAPIDNTQLYIVDESMTQLPIDVPGELCIGGDLVGYGYLKRPELTAKRFVKNPFGNGTLYRTGDLAYWREEGTIEYLGRLDFQVKLRGLRIELGEIENQMIAYPGIQNAVAMVDREYSQDGTLIAYYTSDTTISSDELAKYLSTKLPNYMVPSFYMRLPEMPLTISGKTDRKNLPKYSFSFPTSTKAKCIPETETERMLYEVYSEILSLNDISVEDSFFNIGGNSIKAIQLLAKLYAKYKINLPALYKYNSISTLAKFLDSLMEHSKYIEVNDRYDDEEEYRYVTNLNVCSNPPCNRAILLTGATGFLGVHLLHELLSKTPHTIYCLVRDPKKLRQHIKYYYGAEEAESERIIQVVGDLSFPHFGLSDHEYYILVDKVGVVYHAAADVRHFGNWENLRSVNLDGTIEVIKFCQVANAPIHHISTISVSGDVLTNREELDAVFCEQRLYIGQKYRDNVYVHSKYLAEKAVIDAIRDGSIMGNIYRVGNLLWRSTDGKFQKNAAEHDFVMLTRAFCKLNAIAEIMSDLEVDFTAADQAGTAIIALSLSDSLNQIYHISNPNVLSMLEYVSHYSAVKVLPYEEFVCLVQHNATDKDIGFLLSYIASMQSCVDALRLQIDCSATTEKLKNIGFLWGTPDQVYFDFFSL